MDIYDKAAASIEDLIQFVGPVPEKNCSCHISPPCDDCVAYTQLRTVLDTAKETLRELYTASLLVK